jgi:adenylylsulfate kinase
MTTIALSRADKERALQQQACIIWLYGRPAAGKTTLASHLERRLAAAGCTTALLDGDGLRAGVNRGLGFSDDDRAENLRRAAEVARLFAGAGLVTICAFITPLTAHRELVRRTIGADDLLEVYVEASFATCVKRDPKGLYAKAATHEVTQFTGLDSRFEPPAAGEAPLLIDTEHEEIDRSVERLYAQVLPRVRR